MNQHTSQVDLGQLFGTVTRVLAENRNSLNSADTQNQNHGDNMVNTFQVITQALQESKSSLPSEQLALASQRLNQQTQSGSAQLYSQGLAQASNVFKNQSAVTPDNALQLVQALLGGQHASQAGMTDLLGTLLGGQAPDAQTPSAPTGADGGGMTDLLGSLLGGNTPGEPAQTRPAGGMEDLLGSLLGGNTPGNQSQRGSAGGIDLNMLLTAGMAFFQARQQGSAPVDAVVEALMAGSQMNASTHRSQSGQLVAQTLIQAISSMVGGAK